MTDIAAYKRAGCMPQVQEGMYSLRLSVIGGYLEARQLKKAGEMAEAFGRGYVHLTSRQSLEIPFIREDDIELVKSELATVGLELGGGGPRVRTVMACPGADVCRHGLIRTQALARRLSSEFSGIELPHKFKVSVTGCPSSCVRPQENDLGIMGVIETRHIAERCSACGLCVMACPSNALALQDDTVGRDRGKCIMCGDCIATCPFGAIVEEARGYRLFVGGKIGRFPRLGDVLVEFIQDEDLLVQICHRVVDFYRAHGRKGERFGCTIDRVGIEALRQAVSPGEA